MASEPVLSRDVCKTVSDHERQAQEQSLHTGNRTSLVSTPVIVTIVRFVVVVVLDLVVPMIRNELSSAPQQFKQYSEAWGQDFGYQKLKQQQKKSGE